MFFVNCEKDNIEEGHTHSGGCNHGEDSKSEDNSLGLKPMNCPAHCLIFSSSSRSWRDLPVKFADFSPLHRHESSGSLKGLTRLRRFVQDDAHIFCRSDQIKLVITECLEFLNEVYLALNFKYRVVLSTRPEVFMGKIEKWNEAEEVLSSCLQELKIPYEINSKDGAFYGPKIDIMIKDALEREHQCGTIQLDFQLPLRFNLSFVNKEGNNESPILIHRAMLGSIERIFAVLIEHNAGKWPFWLSPRQAIINTISQDCIEYAMKVKKEIESKGFFVDVNLSDETIDKKIRNSQVEQFNYILVVGKRERESSTVNVRTRDNLVHGTKTMNELIQEWETKRGNYE
jgi:threonyl-tRNA synthetase